jgi:4-hydroxy-tetrahydrodipicolinate synthase
VDCDVEDQREPHDCARTRNGVPPNRRRSFGRVWRVYDAAIKGDWQTARTEQERLHALRRITKIASARIGGFSATLGAFKAAQVLRGIIDYDGLQPPLLRLNDAERAQVKAVLDSQNLRPIA